MIREGRIAEAIAVYRLFAGVDEYTAMDAVAALEDDIRQGDQEVDAQDDARIRALLAQGNKIEAIKVYRAQTGLGLKAAKDAVEALERGLKR